MTGTIGSPVPDGIEGDPRTRVGSLRHETKGPDLYRRYRVKLWSGDGPAWWVTIPRAMGPYDAQNQARQKAYDEGEDASPIEWVEEKEPESVDDWDRHKGEDELELRWRAGDR